MADHIDITEGSGKTVATDDVGGKQYQRIKLDFGTDGAAAPAVAGAGAVATGVQRVTLASDDPAVALLGTIDSDTNTIQTDTTSIDGKITACNTGAVVLSSGTVTTVSTVTNLAQLGGTAISMNEGALDAGTQRVTLATDDDGVAHLATIAGDTTSIDGKVTACNTGAVVLSSGTVTTVSTVTNLAQMGGAALDMNEGVLGVGTQRVTLATDDDGVLSLGIIDDWDAVHASAASTDGPQVMGAGYSTGLPTDVGADGDAARICTDRYGRVLRGIMPQWFNAIYDSADASGEGETVQAKTASRKIYIMSLTISVDAEMWVKLQDEDSNAITPKFWLKAGGGLTKTYPPEAPLVLNVANKDLEVITEGAGNIGVEVTGYLAP